MLKKHLTKLNTHSWQIPQQLGMEENFLNLIIKIIYKKSTANIIPNCEKVNAFHLIMESKARMSCPIIPMEHHTGSPS